MPYMEPHYSTDPNDKDHKHHNNSACEDGNNIEKKYDTPGTGGYPLCKRCKQLNDEGE
jgi:hypothetical protein